MQYSGQELEQSHLSVEFGIHMLYLYTVFH